MSLVFLESSLKLDATGLTIGGSSNNVLTATLTVDQRSPLPSSPVFTITGMGSSYSASVTKITPLITGAPIQQCLLTITFNQPVSNINFGEIKTLTISESTNGSCSLSVEIDYVNPFTTANWINSEESVSMDDIDLRAGLTSASLNNRLRALLRSTLTSYNQIKNYIKYYSYKEKYLNDIIDFAIATGSSLEPSTSTIVYNSDGNVTSVTTNYATGRYRTSIIKITYTYGSYEIRRVRRRDTVYTDLTTGEYIPLLNSFRIDAVDSSGNVIYNLGTISITRSISSTTYSIPYLTDYNSTLPLETINTDPGNILSDYKYYKTNTITGWMVVA